MTNSEEAILVIANEFESLGFKSLLLGATARDILAYQFGISQSPRRTSDVDFAVFVESWNDLEKITRTFEKNPNITAKKSDKEKITRFYYKSIPFDIVPFGGIEKDHKISWPPFYDTIITVLGYNEALNHSITVMIEGKPILVISPEMLITLKIISWNENRGRHKDLLDISFLIENYSKFESDAYIQMLDHHIDLLENVNFDSDLAEPILIGIKIRAISTVETTQKLISILDNTKNIDQILAIISPEFNIYDEEKPRSHIKFRAKFNALLLGLKTI